MLDLRGVECPTNFVKVRLQLELMNSGDTLEVLIDDGEPIKNVPRAVKEEGHQILTVEKIDSHWKLLIKKQ